MRGMKKSKNNKLIKAGNDIEAIESWLQEYVNIESTFNNYFRVANRFVLWLLYKEDKNEGISKSLIDLCKEDITEHLEFLLDPKPRKCWCGKKGVVQQSGRGGDNWKPFTGPLKQALTSVAFQSVY